MCLMHHVYTFYLGAGVLEAAVAMEQYQVLEIRKGESIILSVELLG